MSNPLAQSTCAGSDLDVSPPSPEYIQIEPYITPDSPPTCPISTVDQRSCPTGYLTESDQVKVFTEESSGKPVPRTPEPLSEQEVSFAIRMVLSELVELAQTVTETDEQAVQYLIDRVKTDVSHYERTTDRQQLVADQADAAVDAMYYMHNCFCKRGVNLSRIFQVVHRANTSKKDPETGTYIRRVSDGKVLKPEGWTPPDILQEIQRQTNEGSWA